VFWFHKYQGDPYENADRERGDEEKFDRTDERRRLKKRTTMLNRIESLYDSESDPNTSARSIDPNPKQSGSGGKTKKKTNLVFTDDENALY
jgi:hypothetical protein